MTFKKISLKKDEYLLFTFPKDVGIDHIVRSSNNLKKIFGNKFCIIQGDIKVTKVKIDKEGKI